MKKEKQFGDLSQFKGRDVKLYRSSDLNNTAIYFTEGEYENRKDAKAFFEVLRFELEAESESKHLTYIRFPNTDYFIEMFEAGYGSAHGNMMTATGENVWEDSGNKKITIHSHDNNLLLMIGDNFIPKFNFMIKVASYDKGNRFEHTYPHETFVNFEEIEKALKLKYLKIPESIRRIEYCYKTKDANPLYFLVDYPAYNFKYNNHRFFVIGSEIGREFKIKNFTRYRDGGTTIITVEDQYGNEHKFFSPTRMPEKVLCEKWDETELVEATEIEKQKLAKLLNLDLLQEKDYFFTEENLDILREEN